MERILNDEDKLRRAEEIYYRRNNQAMNFENKLKTNENRNSFWLNFLIMVNLAVIVFCVQNRNFIFTQEFLNTLNKYNIEVSNKVREFFRGIISETDKINEQSTNDSESINSNINSTNVIEKEENLINENLNNENLTENNIESSAETNKPQILSSTLDEMEEDVNNLKAAYSFINPLKRYC